MGRNVDFLRQVSLKSGVPIVVGGGFFAQPFYPKEIATMSEQQILRALIKHAEDDTLGAFLKAAGASDDVLHRIMVDNPRRFLAFVPKRPRRE